MGALGGITSGLGVGVAAALLRPVLSRLPGPVANVLLGGMAMAATDLPMAGLRLVEPRQWSSAGWATDAVPHVAYGAVTSWTLRALHG